MIAPERWYEYERKYQKYGFDMKPEQDRRRQQKKKPENRSAAPSGNSKKLVLTAVLLLGAMMIISIIMTAYSASIRYDINTMLHSNNVLQGEIENLQAKVYSANNIKYVEQEAKDSLKMVYPAAKKQVYISSDDVPAQGCADIIKDKAYN